MNEQMLFEYAKTAYAALGIDVETAMEKLAKTPWL